MELKSQKAFTLIELLVTVSLMVLFTAGAALYNRGGDKQISLYREQGKVINQLYRVRSLAITTFDRFTDDAEGAPCGYGISIPDDGAALIIFKDMPLADDSCPVYYQNSPQFMYDGGDEFVEEIVLKDVMVVEPNFRDILFVPPDPKVFSNISLSGQPATLRLHAERVSFDLVVSVNQFGQITTDVYTP